MKMQFTKTQPHKHISHRFNLKPHYDRQKEKEETTNTIDDYFTQEQQHELLFCSGLEVCFYATQDCMYLKKKCYFE